MVTIRHVYSDAYKLFEKLLRPLRILIDDVDRSDPAAVVEALPRARLLYLESPSSMVFELQDVGRLAQLARAEGVLTVIDNSWATPLFQKPIAQGPDRVLHAALKHLGGHSDTVAGVVVGAALLIVQINLRTYPYLGAKLSPLEAWLLIRGLRTLPLQLAQHMSSGLAVAECLQRHPQVEQVRHRAWHNHPGRATLTGYSGLFAFDVDASIDVPAFVDSLRLFRLGVSWGGRESLVVPAFAAQQQSPGANSFARFGISPRTVRLHVELDSPESLWADLRQAPSRATRPTREPAGTQFVA